MKTGTLIALTLLALPAAASASLTDDLARIRPLLPAGSDVAQIAVARLRGESEAEAAKHGAENYLIRDIDGDGVADLLVITEENPVVRNYETNAPCASPDEPKCSIVWGKRVLRFFRGHADGGFDPVFANDKMVLGGDDGGVFGDPLNGLAVRKNGAIELSVYGGSAWRWSFADVMQYRNGDLYIVGLDTYEGWNVDQRSQTKSVNYLTGRVIESVAKDGNSPEKTRRYRIPVKPLVRVAEYGGHEN